MSWLAGVLKPKFRIDMGSSKANNFIIKKTELSWQQNLHENVGSTGEHRNTRGQEENSENAQDVACIMHNAQLMTVGVTNEPSNRCD